MVNIRINNLSKTYFVKNAAVKAIDDLSFDVYGGECYGIIGNNGAGKTTLLKLLSGYLKPTSGAIEYNGGISSLIDLGWSIQPQLSGFENIILSAGLLGVSKTEAKEKTSEILRFSGLDTAVMERPMYTFSSGMYLKLAFSIMMAWPKLIMLFDEVLAVGDEGFRIKIVEKLRQLRDAGHTIILVSHDLEQVQSHCDRVMILQQGQKIFEGASTVALRKYYDMIYHKHGTPTANFDGFKLKDVSVIGKNVSVDPDIEVFDANHSIRIIFSLELDHQPYRKDIGVFVDDIKGNKLFGDDTFDWPIEALTNDCVIEWVIPPDILNRGNLVLQVICCDNRHIVGNAKVLHLCIEASAPLRTASLLDSSFYLKGALRPFKKDAFPVAINPLKLNVNI